MKSLVICLAGMLMGAAACAQEAQSVRTFDIAISTHAGGGRDRPQALGATVRQSVSLSEASSAIGRLPRQRNPELSEQHLVVVGRDAGGGEIARNMVIDPTLIRAETIDDDGRVHPREIRLEDASFSVALPDDARIVAIEVLRPRWTGSEFVLDSVGIIPLQD